MSRRKMFTWTRSSRIGVSFMQTPWKLGGLVSPTFSKKSLYYFEVSSSRPYSYANAKRQPKKDIDCHCTVFSYSLRRWQLTVWFFVSGSGSTAPLHPMGTSQSRTAETVTFVSLKIFHFPFLCSFLQALITSVLLNTFLVFTWSSLDATTFGRLFQSVVFVLLVSPIFYILEQKAEFNNQFCFPNTVSIFWLKVCAFKIWLVKLKTLCLPFSTGESTWKCLRVSKSSLRLSFRQSFHLCHIKDFGLTYTLCVVHLLSVWYRKKTTNYSMKKLAFVYVFCLERTMFLAISKLRSACEGVKKLRHWGQ